MSRVTPYAKRPRAKIAAYIKACRLKAGVTQGRVADALGYTSPQFISNWERGASIPPVHALPVLKELIRLNPEKFISLYVESTEEMLRKRLK